MKKRFRSISKRFIAIALTLVTLAGMIAIATPLKAEAASSAVSSVSSYRVNTSGNYAVKDKTASVRTSASIFSATYARLDKGAILKISGSNGNYYKTVMDNRTLYIKKSDVQKASSNTAAKFYYTSLSAALRSGPYEKAAKVTTVAKGQLLTVVGSLKNNVGNQWHIVSYNGKLLYVYAGNLKAAAKVTLQVSGATNTVGVNSSLQLKAKTQPTGLTVSWSSSNKTVATVDAQGRVKGVNPGNAVITAKIGNYLTATYQVNVNLLLKVKTVKQTKNYTCSAAAALAVLRYQNKAANVSDTTLYKSTQSYVYLTSNALNKYLGSGTYTYSTFSKISSYEQAIIRSLKQGSPVIARVAFSKGYFNYNSSGHYTTITGIYYDAQGCAWLKLADSFVHNYKSNTYTNAGTGTVDIPLKTLYNYGTYSGRSAIWLIYNP